MGIYGRARFSKNKIKPVILEVLNELFNISDIEEAKKTPIGRLISLEGKVERLAGEVQQIEISLRSEMSSLRGEMKSLENGLRAEMNSLRTEVNSEINNLRVEVNTLEKTFNPKFEQLRGHMAFMEKILYIILAALAGGLIKINFFP